MSLKIATFLFCCVIFNVNAQTFDQEISFHFYYGTAFDPTVQIFTVETLGQVADHPSFRYYTRTALVHYDAGENNQTQQVLELLTSYLYFGGYNVLLVDYHDPEVISEDNAEDIARSISSALEELFASYDSEQTHFLGHGVGVSILSYVARNVGENGNFVSRITGLNPSRISLDAFFVDTIHSEGGASPDTEGQIAFYVNGGLHPQPGCGGQGPYCSRQMAMRTWSESLRSRAPIFPALLCDTWEAFLAGECNENLPVGNMGVFAQTTLRGISQVQTNTRDPWSRDTPFPTENVIG